MSISAENCKKASKSCFYRWIFHKQKNFFTISKAYQCDPKHHKNIIEIHFEHMWSSHSFLRHFFETHTSDFFKDIWRWPFWPKNGIFCSKFFWPPNFFSPEHTNCHKIVPRHQKYPKPLPKKFVWPSDRNWRKNLKKQTPSPLESSPGGGLKLTLYFKGYLACKDHVYAFYGNF